MKCSGCSLDPSTLQASIPIISDYNPGEVTGNQNTEQQFVIPAIGYGLSWVTFYSDESTLNISGIELTFSPFDYLTGWETQVVMIGDNTGPDIIDLELPMSSTLT